MADCAVCGTKAVWMAKHPEADLYRCPQCTHCFSDPASVVPERYEPEYFDDEHQRWFSHPNVRLFEAIARAFPRSAAVLDAGCGRGDFLRHLRAIRPDLTLTGIDLSPNRDEPGIRYLQGDFLEMEVPEKFDAVVSLAVIEHVADIRGFVARLRALVKPNGLVTIMTLNESSLLYDLARAGQRVGVPLAFNRLYSRHHLHHFTRRSLRALVERHGLHVESELIHNPPLAAIDVPKTNPAIERVLRAGMWFVCKAGEASRRSYLQTLTCRLT
jgi:SAM-dependent methyltransferase